MKIKRLREDSMMARVLALLAAAVIRYRPLFFYPQFLLFGVCVFYTVKNLQFDTSRDNLVGANKKYHQNFLKFKKEFPTQDDLVVALPTSAGKTRKMPTSICAVTAPGRTPATPLTVPRASC